MEQERDYARQEAEKKHAEVKVLMEEANDLKEKLENQPTKVVEVVKEVIKEVPVVQEVEVVKEVEKVVVEKVGCCVAAPDIECVHLVPVCCEIAF